MTSQSRPNNGYPPGWENINVWLPPGLRKRLRLAAATHDVTIAGIVRRGVEQELERLDCTQDNVDQKMPLGRVSGGSPETLDAD